MPRSYDTEIISVGTELLLGHVTNTDSRDISELLSKIGINVRYHTVVGDNPKRLESCIEIAKQRADIIITTGGLGPTCDDLTKVITARAFGLELVEVKSEREGLYEYIKNSRNFTPNNYSQAMLPEGCTVFHNTCGTAPGCAFVKDGKIVVMLPGPPKECYTMFMRSALPYLRQLSDELIVSHSINIFGIGESTVDDMFSGEMNLMKNPSMAPYAKECDCLLQVTAKAKSEAAAEEMLRPVMEHVCQRLGEYVYGVDVENLEQGVFAALTARPMTFATAESCTGGQIAARITALSGASSVYRGGVVSYWTSVKAEVLGVPQTLLDQYGAVSEECARSMAENARRITGADIGLSVTGVAGPDPDERNNPVGLVYVGLASPDGTWCRKLELGKRRRDRIQDLAANHAYDMLRRCLTGLPVEQSGTGKHMEKL